jgi:AAA15 family ATPase/GTPase
MRIGRLKLGNWKNLQEAECALLDRAFFIGPNASGKSNLFDAIRFLRDLTEARGGGLQSAVANRHGLSAIRWIDAKRLSDITLEV